MKNVLVVAFLLGIAEAYSQSLFKTSFEADSSEMIADIASAGSGYFMTGITNSFGSGSSDAFVIKADSSGNTLWSKTYGDANEQTGWSVAAADDGGCLVLGETQSPDTTGRDIFLLKLDADGAIQWSKVYRGYKGEYAGKLLKTVDGYFVTGYTWSFGTANDCLLMKVDNSGNVIWAKHYDGSNFESCFGASLTSDGAIVMVGSRVVISNDKTLIIKTDTAGNLLWSKEYGGIGVDQANSIVETVDGGYVFAGSTNSFGSGALDAYIVKIANDGSHVWTRSPATMSWDAFYDIVNDGTGFVLTGEGYTGDFYVLHINESGYMDWERLFDNGGWERSFCLHPSTTNDGFITAGFSDMAGARDIHLVKFATDGFTCETELTSQTTISTQASTVTDVVVTTGTANLQVSPITFSEASAPFMKNEICTNEGQTGTGLKNVVDLSLHVYPNPAETFISIEAAGDKNLVAKIYNSNGALVYERAVGGNGERSAKTIDLTGFSKGIYHLKISGERSAAGKTLIIQ
jgi:hypothetical protein